MADMQNAGGSNDFDEDEYEQACKAIQKENKTYLDEFETWLEAKGLKDATIGRHLSNVDFYLNVYLLRDGPYHMADGCSAGMLDDFFGYFFVRKCLWSTPTTIRQNIASFKKFYQCMLERGHITEEKFDELLGTVKESKQEWIDFCARYNDPDVDFDDLDLGFPF